MGSLESRGRVESLVQVADGILCSCLLHSICAEHHAYERDVSEQEASALQDYPALRLHLYPAAEHSHPQKSAGRSLQNATA